MARRANEPGTIGNSALFGIVGFNLAWVAGTIGTFLDDGTDVQRLLYSLAAVGGCLGASVLTARHVRAGRELAAGGFALIAILTVAETITGFGGQGAESIFVQLAILYLPAFWLIAFEDWASGWARIAAAVAGVGFAIYGYAHTLGSAEPDRSSPVLVVAYLAWIVAIIGWTMTLNAEND